MNFSKLSRPRLFEDISTIFLADAVWANGSAQNHPTFMRLRLALGALGLPSGAFRGPSLALQDRCSRGRQAIYLP